MILTTDPDPRAVERRPGDIARLVVAGLGTALAGLWAQSGSTVDANLAVVVNDLGGSLQGLAEALSALGTLWSVGAVTVLLLVIRRGAAARAAALAGVGAWLVASGLGELLGPHAAAAGVTVRTGTEPGFPVVSVAVATALAAALAPSFVRPVRRLMLLAVVLVALSALYLGTGVAADVLGGLLLGVAAGAAVHVAFGAPGGRPSIAEIQQALAELGLEGAKTVPADLPVARATVVEAELVDGTRTTVTAFGRDQRDAQLAARLWHSLMYKDPGTPAFGTRLQQVEHSGYALLLAEGAGVHVPHLLKTGVAGPEAALLVTEAPVGERLGDVEGIDESMLASVWHQLDLLHEAGIAHGALGPSRIVVRPDGSVGFADLGEAHIGAEASRRDRDVAALLVVTARAVGNERAIAAAVATLGTERVGRAIPVVQPAALPAEATRGIKGPAKSLKQLRADLTAATGAEDVAPLKIKRLSLVNLGILAGILVALTIAVSSLEGMDWASVQRELADATWGWAVLALVLYPLVPMAWGTALMGCVNADLPFVPTTLTQLACSFLNLITPNGIGGTALQLDYLHHQDVPLASAASAMVLSTGVGGAIQVVLFLVAAGLTATSVESSDSGGSLALGAIALVAVVIGIVLAIPKIRGKVVPAVERAASDIWAVLRNPRKAMQLFGGDLAGNLIYPALLGLCLLAFGHRLDFAQLVVVQVGAGMAGNVAPVPGGIGVQLAALTAGLTAFGIPPTTALATVVVFRGITFALPPVFGFFTLRWLRSRGYA